jgi:hypothetical protein
VVGRKPGKLVGLSPSGVRISPSASDSFYFYDVQVSQYFLFILQRFSMDIACKVFPFALAGDSYLAMNPVQISLYTGSCM